MIPWWRKRPLAMALACVGVIVAAKLVVVAVGVPPWWITLPCAIVGYFAYMAFLFWWVLPRQDDE